VRLGTQIPTLGGMDTAAAIRGSYEKIIRPLQPEHPGGRIDFFVQVEYAFKAVAVVAGIVGLASIWIGGKAVKRRLQ